jgi:hypothetical protein
LIAPESFREPVRPHQPETDRGDTRPENTAGRPLENG